MKSKKIIVYSTICIILGVFLGLLALISGALEKEEWQGAYKNARKMSGLYASPQRVQTSLTHSTNHLKLDIDTSGDRVEISMSDTVDKIEVSYYEDYENQHVVKVEDGTLKIRRRLSLMQHFFTSPFNWAQDDAERTIIIFIPLGFKFTHTEIDISGGSLKATDIIFGKTDDIDISGGRVSFTNCQFNDVDIDLSGGAATFASCQINGDLEVNTSGGDVKLDNSNITGKLEGKTSGGDLRFDKGEIGGKVNYRLSGGYACFNNLVATTDFDLRLSGGKVDILKLPVAQGAIRISQSSSGGSIYLNGKKVGGEQISDIATQCKITARLSGGTINITTK